MISDRMSSGWNYALPPRARGSEHEWDQPQSRQENRLNAIAQMREDDALMAQVQAREAARGAPSSLQLKDGGRRGRMLGPGQMKDARDVVQTKLRGSMLRVDSGDEDDDEPADRRDPWGRAIGRAGSSSSEPPPPPRSFGFPPPFTGNRLVGHACQCTYHTSSSGELRWHPGWVSRATRSQLGPEPTWDYEVFIPIDKQFEVFSFNAEQGREGQDGICFLNAKSKAAIDRFWPDAVRQQAEAARKVRSQE